MAGAWLGEPTFGDAWGERLDPQNSDVDRFSARDAVEALTEIAPASETTAIHY